MNPTYVKYELLRALRNKRGFIFSLIFPVILFYFVAGSNRHTQLGGIPFPTYYLAGMASIGSTAAMVGIGARIASERFVGWNRQLRLTPLSVRSYLRAKLLTGYLVSVITLVLLFIAGATLGVQLTGKSMLHMAGLILIGLVPFAALGVLVGHLFTPDSMGPVLGLGVSFLGLLGGAYGPLAGTHGALHDISEGTPSYWLVEAGHTLVGGHGWDATGWVVIATWTVVVGSLAAWAYQRDTKRV